MKRHISAFEQRPKIHISVSDDKESYLILHRSLTYLELWLINSNNEEKATLLAKVNKGDDSNILSANISKGGKYIAYSDSIKTCLFSYNIKDNTIKKIKTLKNLTAKFLFFSHDETQLILLNHADSQIVIYNIAKEIVFKNNFTLDKSDVILAADYLPIENKADTNSAYESINNNNSDSASLASKKAASANKSSAKKKEGLSQQTSALGKAAEYLCFATLNRKIFFVNLDQNNFTVNENIPYPEALVTNIKFKSDDTLILTCENNYFYLVNFKVELKLDQKYDKYYDVLFKFSPWTEKNLFNFPVNYLKWYNKIFGVATDKANENIILLYTDYNYILVDLEKDLPKYSLIEKKKNEKLRNSEWIKTVKEYHKSLYEKIYKKSNLEDKPLIYPNDHFRPNHDILIKQSSGSYKDEEVNQNFKIVSRFSSILYMNFFEFLDESKNILLIVENDWNKIIQNFRETVAKHNYAN